MDIIKVMPRVNRFELKDKENLSGTFILQTQYRYRLAPHHPEEKSWFSVWTENHFDTLNNSGIWYDVEVHVKFDNNEKKPSIDLLLELLRTANAKMDELLDELLKRAKVDITTKIGPVNDDKDTRDTLQGCILNAYPEN